MRDAHYCNSLSQFFLRLAWDQKAYVASKTPDHSKFPKELREASTNSATPGAISQQNVFPREETEHSTYNKIARAELVVRLICF